MPRDTKDVEKKVIQILADRLDINPGKIRPESKLVEDLGMDSFGAVEVMFELEEKFGINIPENDLANLKTVRNILEYIESKIN